MRSTLVLANVFKFVVFVLFTFMALVYFGVLVVLPLDLLAQLIRLLSSVGLPVAVAALLAAGALGYLGFLVYRAPELYRLVIDVGLQLVTFGHSQIKRFDAIIQAAQAAREEASGGDTPKAA